MDIEEFEKRVKPSAKRSRLEPFQSQIFELKAKGYADWQVKDWLAENGLTVSRQAVQQFIKKREAQQPASKSTTPQVAAAATPKASGQGVAIEARSDLPQTGAGKTLTEQVMNTAPEKFSFKQQQKSKDQK